MEKSVKKYVKIYRTALEANNFTDIDLRVESYEQRLKEMYASKAFEAHNVYSTMDVTKIYVFDSSSQHCLRNSKTLSFLDWRIDK